MSPAVAAWEFADLLDGPVPETLRKRSLRPVSRAAWDAAKHPRVAHGEHGGEFARKLGAVLAAPANAPAAAQAWQTVKEFARQARMSGLHDDVAEKLDWAARVMERGDAGGFSMAARYIDDAAASPQASAEVSKRLKALSHQVRFLPEGPPLGGEFKAIQDVTAKLAEITPGLLGGGKEQWNGKITVSPEFLDTMKQADLAWDGHMDILASVAEHVWGDVRDQAGTAPEAHTVALHEMIHGVTSDGDTWAVHARDYSEPNTAAIEEGFTELGTIQHAAEAFEALGIGSFPTAAVRLPAGVEQAFSMKGLIEHQHDLRRLKDTAGGEGGYAGSMEAYNSLCDAVAEMYHPEPDPVKITQDLVTAAELTHNTGLRADLTELMYQVGVGDVGVQRVTLAEYAKRVNTAERIIPGHAWGHYGTQTQWAYEWCWAAAVAEGLTGPALDARVVELANEVNREGPAFKEKVLATQMLRALGLTGKGAEFANAGLRADIRDQWIKLGGQAVFNKVAPKARSMVAAYEGRHPR